MKTPNATLCQSCSMPLARAEDFGTDADGMPAREYCRYCFQAGGFTNPKMTMVEMIDLLAGMSEKMNMTPAQARAMGQTVLPTLRRWRETRAVATSART